MTNKSVSSDKQDAAASAGESNGYVFDCAQVAFKAPYQICLQRIARYESGNSEFFPGCADAIRAGECLAQAMRLEERKAGRAIYFAARKVRLEPALAMPLPTIATGPQTPAPATSPPSDLYAAAIEAAMKEGPSPAVPAAPIPKPPPGLTLRELAKFNTRNPAP